VIRLTTISLWHFDAGSGRRPPHQFQTHASQQARLISGHGRRCEWLADPATPVANAPEWLVADLGTRACANAALVPSGCVRCGRVLAEVAALATAMPGTRNDALNRAALALFQLVTGCELDAGTVADQLVQACEVNGLIGDDGLRSIASRAGRHAAPARPPISARFRGGVPPCSHPFREPNPPEKGARSGALGGPGRHQVVVAFAEEAFSRNCCAYPCEHRPPRLQYGCGHARQCSWQGGRTSA
jgi:hypothetical protein